MGGKEEREVFYLLRRGGGGLGIEIHYKWYSVTVYTRDPH